MEFPGFKLDVTALRQFPAPAPEFLYDLIILGGGPAAMSATIYAARKLLKIAIVTKDFGGQMLETGEVENWLGYRRISASELVENFTEHVTNFNAAVSQGPSVVSAREEDGKFIVSTDNNKQYRANSLIIAIGKRRRQLGVPGEVEFSGRGVAYCATCDAPFFTGKVVVLAGGANSAFTTAIELLRAGASVTLVNSIAGWQADGALQEKASEFGNKIKLLDFHEVLGIEGRQRVTGVRVRDRRTEREQVLPADGIFIEIGLISNTDVVNGLVELNDQGEITVDCACRTSREGVFAAGDVTTVPYKQIIIAAGEGAKAALAAYAYLLDRDLV
jgi:NADH-dependent peroxiredoxin subunit F